MLIVLRSHDFFACQRGGLSLHCPKLHNDCLIFREIDSYNAFIKKVKNNLLNSEFELKNETREKKKALCINFCGVAYRDFQTSLRDLEEIACLR